jgi:hypothetical protein
MYIFNFEIMNETRKEHEKLKEICDAIKYNMPFYDKWTDLYYEDN